MPLYAKRFALIPLGPKSSPWTSETPRARALASVNYSTASGPCPLATSIRGLCPDGPGESAVTAESLQEGRLPVSFGVTAASRLSTVTRLPRPGLGLGAGPYICSRLANQALASSLPCTTGYNNRVPGTQARITPHGVRGGKPSFAPDIYGPPYALRASGAT